MLGGKRERTGQKPVNPPEKPPQKPQASRLVRRGLRGNRSAHLGLDSARTTLSPSGSAKLIDLAPVQIVTPVPSSGPSPLPSAKRRGDSVLTPSQDFLVTSFFRTNARDRIMAALSVRRQPHSFGRAGA